MRPPICDKTAPPHLENPGSATATSSDFNFIFFLVIFAGISPTPAYKANKGKDSVQTEFKKQCDVFQNKVDFVLGEVRSRGESALLSPPPAIIIFIINNVLNILQIQICVQTSALEVFKLEDFQPRKEISFGPVDKSLTLKSIHEHY